MNKDEEIKRLNVIIEEQSEQLRLNNVSNAERTFCPRCNSNKVSKSEYAPYPLYYCDNCFNKWAI